MGKPGEPTPSSAPGAIPLRDPDETMSKMEQGTRMLLARHAETSAPDRFHGAESDVDLSDWGIQQSERLGQVLKHAGASALYCSALRRAVATAIPIGRACGLEPLITVTLHERR